MCDEHNPLHTHSKILELHLIWVYILKESNCHSLPSRHIRLAHLLNLLLMPHHPGKS